MSICAYVFVECDGEPAEVVRKLRKVKGITRADGLFGVLEAIAIVEAKDLAGVDEVVVRLQEVPGVAFTDTRIARDIS